MVRRPPDTDSFDAPPPSLLVIDGSNVYASRPDGWWKDRADAARRLAARLQTLFIATGERAILIFDPLPRGTGTPSSTSHVEIRIAADRGRNAADDAIVTLVRELGPAQRLTVITSDRRLRERVAALDTPTQSSGTLLRRLEEAEQNRKPERPAPPISYRRSHARSRPSRQLDR